MKTKSSRHHWVQVGMWARHPKFGVGRAMTSIHCDGDGVRECRCEATFMFGGIHGEKRLLLRYAPLDLLATQQDFDSPPEIRLYLHLVQAGMPVPQVQYPVSFYRIDMAYPSIKLAIEVDGLAFHGTQEAFIRDQRRQRELQRLGWTVIRFAAKEVNTQPSACVRDIAEAANRLATAK